MIRLNGTRIIAIVGDETRDVAVLSELLVREFGTAVVAAVPAIVEATIVLEGYGREVEKLVRALDSQRPVIATTEAMHGFGRRRGKGERKRNRGSRWA